MIDNIYKNIVSSMPFIYVNMDLTGKIIECNEAMGKSFGLKPEDINGKYLYEFDRTHTEEFYNKKINECIEKKSVFFQIQFLFNNDVTNYFNAHFKIFDTGGHDSKSIVAILTNTTSEVEHVNELEFMNSVFLEVIDSSYRGLFIVKSSGSIMYTNNRFSEFFNVNENLIDQNRSVFDKIIGENAVSFNKYKTFTENCYKSKKELSGVEIEFKDGRIFLLSYEPVLQNDEVVAHIFFYNDITEGVNAKKHLVSQKLFYDKLIEDMPIEVVIFDAKDLKIINANDKALENPDLLNLYSYETNKQEFKKTGEELEKLKQKEKYLIKSIEEKAIVEYDDFVSDQFGVKKFYRRYVSPYLIEDDPKFVTEFGVDLTEIIESKNRLEKSEANMSALVSSLNDMVFELNLEGEIEKIWTNDNSNLSIPAIQMIGKTASDYTDEIVSIKFKELFKKCLTERTTEYLEFKGLHKFYQLTLSPVLFNDKVSRVSVLLKNITDQKKQETLLAESDAKYRLISENVVDLISVHTMQGDFIFTSKSYETILGYEQDELIGKNALSIIHPDYHNVIVESLQILSKANPTDVREFKLFKKDGSLVYVEGVAKALFDNDGNVTSCQVLCRDIDKRKAADDLILNALENEKALNMMRTKLVSTVSHEFRTPLSTIYSSTELIEMYLNKYEKIANKNIVKHLEIIKEEIDRITQLMDDVLHLTKEDSKNTKSKIEIFNLAEICLKVIENNFSNDKEGRKIISHFESQEMLVEGDRNLITYSIINLINNAFKYSEGRGDVELNLSKDEHNVMLKIIDKGIGIPESDLPYLFNTFYRAKNTDGIPGTGLGLVIVKTFIEKNKGKIYLESKINKGTTATIQLPIYTKIED